MRSHWQAWMQELPWGKSMEAYLPKGLQRAGLVCMVFVLHLTRWQALFMLHP
jgi:hypothetical protein